MIKKWRNDIRGSLTVQVGGGGLCPDLIAAPQHSLDVSWLYS